MFGSKQRLNIDLRLLKNLDIFIVVNVILLLLISLVVLASASASATNEPFYYVNRQLLWILLGFAAMIIMITINYKHLSRASIFLYIANIGLLLFVLLVGDGSGAKRWIDIGFISFQPAELSKIIMIVCFADFLVKWQGNLNKLRNILLCILFFVPPLVLIILQPDLGTSLVFIAIMFGMLLAGGANLALLFGLGFTGIGATAAAIWAHLRFGLPLPLADYQIMRLLAFLDPYADGLGGSGAGYHIIQSQVAIGSGGVLGKGLFQGSQVQLHFLPEHHTDFIFSIIGEEFGFIGAVVVLLLFFTLIYRTIKIASEAQDMFGVLLVIGFSSMIAFHVLVNVGMAIGVMPVTGLPLPFVSYGGTSVLSSMIGLGLVLNVHMRRKTITF